MLASQKRCAALHKDTSTTGEVCRLAGLQLTHCIFEVFRICRVPSPIKTRVVHCLMQPIAIMFVHLQRLYETNLLTVVNAVSTLYRMKVPCMFSAL